MSYQFVPNYGGVARPPTIGYCYDPNCPGHFGGSCAYDVEPVYATPNGAARYLAPSYLTPSFMTATYGAALALPTPNFWLDLSRAFAKVFGYSGRFTTSTEAGLAMERATGIPFEVSKGIFHGGVGALGLLVLKLFNAPTIAAIGAGIALWRWLESLDQRAQRQ